MPYVFHADRRAVCYTKGRNGHKITTIVVHHWDDPARHPTIGGVLGWFENRRSRVSAHYVVEAGHVYQMVDLADTAWHAGNRGVNQVSIGIECNPRCSEADKQTVGELIKFLQNKFGGLKIIGHKDVKPTGCPGRYYPPASVLAPYINSSSVASASQGTKTLEQLADEVLAGVHGDGEQRRKSLGTNFQAVQNIVNRRLQSKVFAQTPASSGGGLLRQGSRGENVKQLQAGLNKVFPAYSRLAVDGIYGAKTRQAVQEFQRRSGLAADGIVGKNTKAALRKYGIIC